MRNIWLGTSATIALFGVTGTLPALAQDAGADAAVIRELRQQMQAMQRRLDQLEARPAAPRPAAAPAPRATPRGAAPAVIAAPAPVQTPEERRAEVRAVVQETLSGEASRPMMQRMFDDAFQGDMPNSIRIPGTNTSVRLYGFIKTNLYGDLNMVNRTDAPTVSATPLAGSNADLQNGDISFSARRSRIGLETSTPAGDWGNFVARLEMDFAGTNPSASNLATSNSFSPRLRQAWVSVGGDVTSVLVGQSDSLWNLSPIETMTDATFLNGSGVRQAQFRLTGRLAPGLTGAVSLESPYTDYTQNGSVQYPDANLNGGASPATNLFPDVLGRLTYSRGWGSVALTGIVRELRIDTNGTTATPNGTATTIGYGGRLNGSLNLNQLASFFGNDQLIGLGYYGEGIGRYNDSATNGQGAFSDLGLPGVNSVSLTPTPSWGLFAGYRRFWSTQFRSNFGAAYGEVDAPAFTNQFSRGSSTTQTLNNSMQMYVANLIWSPFATERNGRITNGNLDVGIEYQYYRRDLQGGAVSANTSSAPNVLGGYGIEQRLQATLIGRF